MSTRGGNTSRIPSYRLTSHGAAELLGVSRERLEQLGDKRLLPYLRHHDRTRLCCREQLLTIARARG